MKILKDNPNLIFHHPNKFIKWLLKYLPTETIRIDNMKVYFCVKRLWKKYYIISDFKVLTQDK